MTVKADLAVKYMPVGGLEPYAKNSRTHSEKQVEQIAASITEFGFTNPVLVDGADGIIAGHGRLLAAKLLGMAEVPTIELAGLSAAQKRAYIIADNKLALNAGWDDAILADELRALGEEGFDLELTGFGGLELEAFMPSAIPGEDGDGSTLSLADKFGIPPFSVLNAREGWWQGRKRAWLAIGIKSELGRGEQLIPNGGADEQGKIRRLTWNIDANGRSHSGKT